MLRLPEPSLILCLVRRIPRVSCERIPMNLADAAPSADKPSVSTTAGQRSFVRPAIAVQHFQWFIATNAAIASIVSLFLVLQGATDEPYVSFRTSDALSQIGLGCAL